MPIDVEWDDIAPNSANPEVAVNNALAKIKAALLELEGGGGSGGLPPGGLTGQILAKLSNDDGDADWIDPPTGGGDGEDDSGLVTYRYYRYTGIGTYAGGALVIGDLDHYNGIDERVQPVATTEGTTLTGFGDLTAANCIDEDPTTIYHSSGSTTDWIQYDFGSPGVTMSRVVMTQGTPSRLNQRAVNLQIQGSDDGTTFQTLLVSTPLTWSGTNDSANTAEVIVSSGEA